MPFFVDDFTDTAGTALTSHTPTGSGAAGSWGGAAAIVITDADRIRTNSGVAGLSCIGSVAPASGEYDVEADFVVFTVDVSTLHTAFGAHCLTNTTDQTRDGYWVRVGADGVELVATVTGARNVIASVPGATWNTGGGPTAVYHAKLTVRANASNWDLTVTVTRSDGQYLKSDGSYQAGAIACISLTDSTYSTLLAAAGKPGVLFYSILASNTTGIHLDNFVASDVGGAATPAMVAVRPRRQTCSRSLLTR